MVISLLLLNFFYKVVFFVNIPIIFTTKTVISCN